MLKILKTIIKDEYTQKIKSSAHKAENIICIKLGKPLSPFDFFLFKPILKGRKQHLT